MIKAAQDLGLEIIYCGALLTPALAYYGMRAAIPSIMVTGSRIPFDRNGFKFYTATGEITKADEQRIQDVMLGDKVNDFGLESLPPSDPGAKALFQKRYTDLFPATVLQGKRIGIYEHSSVGRGFD
ncbi:hypothetical protein P4S72_07065 [Vibrio sp. PP-XX7]